ncbi:MULTISPECIES: LysR family transcriptional regulator [unclassified Streptomyces]|uniref:LysR family transcriptional regulator n=1 Tax=unclassified Streptomyces TaxID=2593676 RepID=UPI00190734B9|nr:LysR family transcriptional regulator [Streptomyces sp. HSG2]
MQIQQLRAFREVARELSFTRAARNLHYAQSSVTAQIKSLEEAVGAQLFDRTRRQLSLTAAGVSLLPHADRIMEITEAARRDVARARPGGRPTTESVPRGRPHALERRRATRRLPL